jgi:hypothetical protein
VPVREGESEGEDEGARERGRGVGRVGGGRKGLRDGADIPPFAESEMGGGFIYMGIYIYIIIFISYVKAVR